MFKIEPQQSAEVLPVFLSLRRLFLGEDMCVGNLCSGVSYSTAGH